MTHDELNDFRAARLADLLEQKFNKNKTALGKALGYGSGAFVRQMLDRERPITEKTVARVNLIHGCGGWFDLPTTNTPTATLKIYENHNVKRPSAPPNKDDPANQIAGIPGSLHLIRTATYTSPHVVEWEQLMSMIDRDGPGFLEAGVWVAIRDDAMAPGLSPGDLAYFVRGLAPKPGGRVLVRGRNFPPEVRGYRHITPGIFEAVPTNTAGYATLHSERDDLEVLAVLVRYTKEEAY